MKSQSIEENLELVQKILVAKSIEELQTFGTYLEVKTIVESTLCVTLGVRSWQSLMAKLQMLKTKSVTHKVELQCLAQEQNADSSVSIAELLGVKVKKVTLGTFINRLEIACNAEFEKEAALFERTKQHNFIHSSRLEGINITRPNQRLEQILARYPRV